MTLAAGLTWFVALEHVGFLVLEMFFWTRPLGLKIFRQRPEAAAASRVLAANQGLYNGFLAAGLVIGSLLQDASQGRALQVFCLASVVVAGLFGGATVSWRIWLVQALPAALALGALAYAVA